MSAAVALAVRPLRRRAGVGHGRHWYDCVRCPLQTAKQTSV